MLTKVGRSGSGGAGGLAFGVNVSSLIPSDTSTVTVEDGAMPVAASTTVTPTDGVGRFKHSPEQAESVATVAVAANANTPLRRTLASFGVIVYSALPVR